jgi:uncharacterized protein
MPSFHIMTKPIGPVCNLDCRYCFYLDKLALYPETKVWRMPDDVLENFVRQYIEAQDGEVVSFAWQGGEPTLLGVPFFEKVVALQQRYANGKRIENALQTNGVLLDAAWGEFLAQHQFLVGISIDGPEALHDVYRVDRNGRPTFEKVMAGLEVLRSHRVAFNLLTTVHRANAAVPLDVYRFLKQYGSGYLQFIPVVEREAEQATAHGLTLLSPDAPEPARVTDWSVGPEQFGRFLSAIFDEWVRHDVGQQFVQLFEETLAMWMGRESSLCVFRPTCGMALAMERNGDLYSCDHFVYPENRLGNILDVPLAELVQTPQQQKFGQAKRDLLPRYCRECEVRFACNGECPKHRFLHTPDGEPGLNYLCAGYKMFFNHVRPYMDYMAGELRQYRSPVSIMAVLERWGSLSAAAAVQTVAAGHGGQRQSRNERCACGSGLKYKRCCGR